MPSFTFDLASVHDKIDNCENILNSLEGLLFQGSIITSQIFLTETSLHTRKVFWNSVKARRHIRAIRMIENELDEISPKNRTPEIVSSSHLTYTLGMPDANQPSPENGSSSFQDFENHRANENLPDLTELASRMEVSKVEDFKNEEETPNKARESLEEMGLNLRNAYGYTNPSENLQLWLESSKIFWGDLKKNKKKLKNSAIQADNSVNTGKRNSEHYIENEYAEEVEPHLFIPGVSGMSPLQLKRHNEENEFSKLQIRGFINVNNFLLREYPSNLYVSVGGSMIDNESHNSVNNPSYCFEDDPLPGWKKEIVVRIGGKTIGDTDVVYVPPDKTKRLRNRPEVSFYLQKNNLSIGLVTRFDFRTVFCVCLTPENGNRNYVECSFGLAGCRGWIHTDCVGLGIVNDKNVQSLGNLVCPFCAAYLEGCRIESSVGKDKKLLRKMTIQYPTSVKTMKGFQIHESSCPHEVWGMKENPLYRFSSIVDDSNSNITKKLILKKLPAKTLLPSKETEIPIIVQSAFDEKNLRSQKQFSRRGAISPGGKISNSSANAGALDTSAIPEFQGLKRIFQHKLFDGAVFSPSISSSFGLLNKKKGVELTIEKKLPRTNLEPEKSDSDDSIDMQIEFDSRIEPKDRHRFAKLDNGNHVRIRVSGGWMVSSNQQVLEPTAASKSKDPSADSSHSMQKRIKELANQKVVGDQPLHIRFKRELIESAVNQLQNKKRVVLKSTSSGTEGFKSTSTDDTGNLRRQSQAIDSCVESSIITLLPLEDGGVRWSCVSTTCVVKSLHVLCFSSLWCGLCLTKISSDDVNDKPPTMKKSQPKPKKKTLKRDSAILDEEEEVVPYVLQEKTVGSVTYTIHAQCAYIFDNNAMNTDIQRFGTIRINNHYHYDEIDDADCDLCGRRGAIMFYFDINTRCSTTPPPSNDGWLGHLPCIYWLANSGLLIPADLAALSKTLIPWEPLKIPIIENSVDSGREVSPSYPDFVISTTNSDILNLDSESSSSQAQVTNELDLSHEFLKSNTGAQDPIEYMDLEHTFENQADSPRENSSLFVADSTKTLRSLDSLDNRASMPNNLSRFDMLIGTYKCALCGSHTGITLRCCALACTVRAHALCISIASEAGWALCKIRSLEKLEKSKCPSAEMSHSGLASITCFCPIHSQKV